MRGRYFAVLALVLVGSWAAVHYGAVRRTSARPAAPAPRSGLAASAWPKFCGGAGNAALGVRSSATGKIRWTFQTGARVSGSAAVGPDGTVYIWSDEGSLYALDGRTGAKKWGRFTRLYPWWRKVLDPHAGPGVNGSSSPAVGAAGIVYIGSHDSHVYALNASTGVRAWIARTGAAIEFPPAIGPDGTVYTTSGDGKLYAMDGLSGRKRWVFSEGRFSLMRSTPAIGQNGTVYIGAVRGKLYALDGTAGTRIWEFAADGDAGTPVIGRDGTVYCASSRGRLYALNATTGAKIWEWTAGKGMLSSPAIGSDGAIYIGFRDSSSGWLYALDGRTHILKWKFGTGAIMPHPAVSSDSTVYVSGCGVGGGKLYAIDGRIGRKKWATNIGGGLTRFPAIGRDGTVYVGTTEGKVCAIY